MKQGGGDVGVTIRERMRSVIPQVAMQSIRQISLFSSILCECRFG